MEQLISDCYTNVKQFKGDMLLGMSCDVNLHNNAKKAFVEDTASRGYVDLVIPRMNVTITGELGYYQELSDFIDITQSVDVAVVPSNLVYKLQRPVNDKVFFADKQEINYQMYLNNQLDLNSYISENYSSLLSNVYPVTQDIKNMSKVLYSKPNNKTKLKIPKELTITSPANEITINSNSYFITGLSNPKFALTVNGYPIYRHTENGGFGVLVNLVPGENIFNFSCGDIDSTVIIHRMPQQTVSGITPIDKIVPSEAFPPKDTAYTSDTTVMLQCTAPYGAVVTAKVGDDTYSLTPAYASHNGVPIIYSVAIPHAKLNPKINETIDLGIVTYSQTYNGLVTNQKSKGKIYLVGKNAQLAVQVNKYSANVLINQYSPSNYLTTLKHGSIDYVSSVSENYYGLKSGGFISKDDVNIVNGVTPYLRKVENVIIQPTEKGENLNIIGAAGAPFHIKYDNFYKILSITLFNVTNMPEILAHLESDIFSNISIVNNPIINSSTITMKLKDGKTFGGYNVSYLDKNLILYCKEAHVPNGTSSMPLDGITIVLDAGHGGADLGNVGIAGSYGPSEKDLNLAVANLTKARLESLGAEVHLTRSDDESLPKQNRIATATALDPDLFISFHHDIAPADIDGNNEFGMKIFYSNPSSEHLASMMINNVATLVNRSNNGYFLSNEFEITNITLAPALLFDLGYLSNPLEYEKSCNPFEMYRISCYIGDTIVKYFSD
ncbi:MAG: N-acetylmuramoyl-L-alanine amidase [Oscillospiraceae bacterium]